MNTKKLIMAALLTSIAIIIPFAVFFKVVVPPFSATLGSHVPMFISMLLGPKVAAIVGLGSAFGFFLNLGPAIGARASMHIFVGIIGAELIKKGVPFGKVSVITAPLHGLFEALIIIPFTGFEAYNVLLLTGVGSILHHFADAFIAYLIINILQRSKSVSTIFANNN